MYTIIENGVLFVPKAGEMLSRVSMQFDDLGDGSDNWLRFRETGVGLSLVTPLRRPVGDRNMGHVTCAL